jgi:hypothetical protein
VRRDDEDDHSGGAGGSSWVDRIVIPDDISDLDAEIRALHRERRAQRRRARLRRLTGSGRTGAPLLLVALLLIAGVAGLLVMLQPRRTAGNVTPLGTAQADHRLPAATVTYEDSSVHQIRDLRPAVFALAPNGCSCAERLNAIAVAAESHNIRFYLVDRLAPAVPPGMEAPAIPLIEPNGVVAEKYNAEKNGKRVAGGPVLVLVAAGGDVLEVLPEVTPRALEDGLSQLEPKAAPAS